MVDLTVESNIDEWRRAALNTAMSFTDQQTVQNLNAMLGQRLQTTERQMFRTQGGFGRSGNWKPLSPEYAELKAKKYPGKTILRREDRLFRSLTATSEDSVSTGTGGQGLYVFRFGSRVPYTIFHQRGTPRMPARKLFDMTGQQLRGLAAAMGRTITEGLFTRGWFDRRDKTLVFKNTGFDRIED
jgi:phage gpG-like protein